MEASDRLQIIEKNRAIMKDLEEFYREDELYERLSDDLKALYNNTLYHRMIPIHSTAYVGASFQIGYEFKKLGENNGRPIRRHN